MKKVLDLSVFEESTMELRINKELTLQLQKPTQKMVIEFLKFRNIDENTDAEIIVRAMDALTTMILNANDQGKKFTLFQVNDLLNTQQKLMIITAYSEFITEVQNNPN